MRTTKRFTPDVLDGYRAIGRGLGTFESYIPWHRVSRSDPASRGRSHLITWRGRHYELLSDGELLAFLFCTPLLALGDDLREQFPLSLEAAPHELAAYDARYAAQECPGTLDIAKQLGIRHPQCRGSGRSAPWVMTTDLLKMRCAADGARSLLAVACKDGSALPKRDRELLTIEKEYWSQRDASWLFLSRDLYHPSVGETLQRTWPWASAPSAPDRALSAAERAVTDWPGRSLTFILQHISEAVHDSELAKRALWQGIWWGRIPVDLRRGWRPHIPLQLISSADFKTLNPVSSGRSAWN